MVDRTLPAATIEAALDDMERARDAATSAMQRLRSATLLADPAPGETSAPLDIERGATPLYLRTAGRPPLRLVAHPADRLLRLGVEPALSLLPEAMDSREARVMLIAIAMQESRAIHRVQIGGPARGFWQFERGGGVAGVLRHAASREHAVAACERLGYAPDVGACYTAIADNDVLAGVFARLLLWTLPQALPDTPEEGWRQYLDAWRPGKPHPGAWPQCWDIAQHTVAPG